MSTKSKIISVLAVFFVAVAVIAYNKSISSNDKIVAKIGNDPIYESEVIKEFEQMVTKSGKPEMKYDSLDEGMKENIVKSIVLGNLVDQKAIDAGVEKSSEYKEVLAYTLRELRQKIFLDEQIKKNVTDSMVKKSYDDFVTKMKDEKEVKLDYILCEKEDDAKKMMDMLKNHSDFASLVEEAKKNGISAKFEQLDFFAQGEMMSGDTEDKIFTLKKGEVAEPVKTEFGWSIFKLVDSRPKTISPYGEMEASLRNGLVEKFIADFVTNLEKEYKVEFSVNGDKNAK